MTVEEINDIACEIIAYAGESKSFSMEAISNAEEGDLDGAAQNLASSKDSLTKAHVIHTDLLVEEAKNPGCITATMMLIHASNHMSSAETTLDLAEKFVNIYRKR